MALADNPSSASANPENQGIAPFERIDFSPEHQRHIDMMRDVAVELTQTAGEDLVLKGGTALLLAYGLPRFSTDLDFDCRRTNIDLKPGIERAAKRSHEAIRMLSTKKDTATTRRHMLHYGDEGSQPFKIEVSYRDSDRIGEDDVALVDGIRVYKIEKLANLKIKALLNRTKARDIFDVSFLLNRYSSAVTDSDLQQIDQLVTVCGIDDLEARMASDSILSRHDLTHVAVELADNVDKLKRRREL